MKTKFQISGFIGSEIRIAYREGVVKKIGALAVGIHKEEIFWPTHRNWVVTELSSGFALVFRTNRAEALRLAKERAAREDILEKINAACKDNPHGKRPLNRALIRKMKPTIKETVNP